MKITIKRVIAGMGILFLAFVGWLVFQLFLIDNTIVVSKQTTHWTEPLKPNRLPDFQKILLDAQREGVTPENNGAIQFWRAVWPGDLAEKDRAPLLAELGMETPTRDGMKSFYEDKTRNALRRWLKDQAGLTADSFDEIPAGQLSVEEYEALKRKYLAIDDFLSTTSFNRPWTAQQVPPMATWVEENNEFLDLLVEAGEKPKFYNPSPTLLTEPEGTLFAVLLPGVNSVRTAVRGLIARSMLHVGEGDYEAAWTDIRAVYKLADKLDWEYATLVEVLVQVSCQGMADSALLELLAAPDVPAPLVEQITAEMAARPKIEAMARSMDNMERMVGVDAAIGIAQDMTSFGNLEALTANGPSPRKTFTAQSRIFDWNLILTNLNQWYDRFAAASAEPDWTKRAAMMDQIEKDLSAWSPGASTIAAAIVSRRARSEARGNVLVAMLVPAVTKAMLAEDRINVMQDLMTLSAALAVYRVQQGEYPESLDALAPGILQALPVDLYHGQPYVYRREGEGYLLYTLGGNQVDEGGSNQMMQTVQGYPAGGDHPELVYEALGLAMPELAPDVTPEKRMGQLESGLSSYIPEGADDYSIRMPLVPADWRIPEALAPEGGGAASNQQNQ